jgi:CheY-like chemotaxis protein
VNVPPGPHTILLVEDEAIIALAQAAALKRYGYRVVTAFNGRDAVAKAEQDTDLDLFLMDIDLGSGMDGTEAARAILQRRNIPVVFLSSHTERDVVEKTEQITSYGYVVKNSGETVLVASIKMAYKLFESEQRYRFLFEQSPLGILQFDERGIIQNCNVAYEDHAGVKRGTIIGLNRKRQNYHTPMPEPILTQARCVSGNGG